MAELQNANPTIINLSELPTRRRQRQTQRRPGDDLVSFSPRPPHWEKLLHETFEGFESKSVSDSSDAEDPIDEQEIFGMCDFSMSPMSLTLPLGAYQPCDCTPVPCCSCATPFPEPTSLADFVSWLFRLLHTSHSPAAQHLVSWGRWLSCC